MFQGKMTGGQARDAFIAYNEFKGFEVVDMSRNYNTGDKYSNRIGTGNQIDLAFAEINADVGDDVFGLKLLDWSDGTQIKAAFLKLYLLIDSATSAPLWLASLPETVKIAVGSPWPFALGSMSLNADTFTSNLFLPSGITLNADGTFTGTATFVGSGTAEFTATNANGDTKSPWIKWSVIPV